MRLRHARRDVVPRDVVHADSPMSKQSTTALHVSTAITVHPQQERQVNSTSPSLTMVGVGVIVIVIAVASVQMFFVMKKAAGKRAKKDR